MYKTLISISALLLLWSGCNSSSSKATQQEQSNINETLNKSAKEYFGSISDATINIYELGEGERKLLFSENTTMGENLDEIGNFNAHTQSLNSQIFYLYELIGGKNWDIDHNGIIDSVPTTNSSIYRSIYKGKQNHVAWWGTKKSIRNLGLSEKF